MWIWFSQYVFQKEHLSGGSVKYIGKTYIVDEGGSGHQIAVPVSLMSQLDRKGQWVAPAACLACILHFLEYPVGKTSPVS